MKHFFLVAFSFFLSQGFGQLVITENEDSEQDYKLSFTVKNVGMDTAVFYWEIETVPAMPTKWEIAYVYDQVNCYPSGSLKSDCTEEALANILLPGDSTFYYQIGIDVKEEFEDACIIYRLVSSCDSQASDTLGEINFKFDSDIKISSTKELKQTTAIPFPNPVTNTLSFSNDDRVAQIRITDLQGQEIKHLIHRPRRSHDLSYLAEGVYLLRLSDMSDRHLQTLKIIKKN